MKSKLKHLTISIFFGLLLTLFLSSFLFPQSGKRNKKKNFQNVTIGLFTVQIPIEWKIFNKVELDQFKNEYIKQSDEISQRYSGEQDQKKSVNISAFYISNDAGSFIIVSFKIPPQSNLMNLLKKQARDKAEWGIQNGYIKKYLGLVPINDRQFSGFYVTFIGMNDEVQISAGLEYKKLKNTLIQLTLLCPQNWDAKKATFTLKSILNSIKLNGKRKN